ncbi:MAG: tetratricopeptide repeat protein [Acidobacteriota bacterium]
MNAPRHPTAALDHLLEGQCDQHERQTVVRHLLAGCPECSQRASRALRISQQEKPSEKALDSIFDRLVEKSGELIELVDREHLEAEALLADIEALPLGRRAMVLQNSSKYRRRAVCHLLIERSIALRHEDPAEGLHQAELAVAIARQLAIKGDEELLARALLELANGKRITGDPHGADREFRAAALVIERAASDPQLQADFLFFLASQRYSQSRWPEALDLLREAERAYRRLGDSPSAAQCLIKASMCLTDLERHEEAISTVWKALEQIGPNGDLKALLSGIHNLAFMLSRTGALDEAIGLIDRARPIYRVGAGETDRLRLDWTEAKIYRDLSQFQDSERILLRVRERFVEEEFLHDAALVSLDLAELFVHQGRVGDLQELAREMFSVFSSLGIAPEALTALAMLRQSVAHGAETLAQIQQIAGAIEQARQSA